MLKRQVCIKGSVCIIDNLHSQNSLLRLSSTSSDLDLSGQGSEILSAMYVQLGPILGWEESCCMSSGRELAPSGHLRSHTIRPHTPLFLAYCADYVTLNNARHGIKRETFGRNYSLNLTLADLQQTTNFKGNACRCLIYIYFFSNIRRTFWKDQSIQYKCNSGGSIRPAAIMEIVITCIWIEFRGLPGIVIFSFNAGGWGGDGIFVVLIWQTLKFGFT